MKIKKWIIHNFWMKIFSLVLAVTTWFYVTWQLEKAKAEERRAIFSMIHYDIVSKVLPIHVTIAGTVKDGYEVIEKDITVDPVECMVIGPKNILEGITAAKTAPIDISGHTKDVNIRVSLAPISSGIATEDEFIKVHIPITKKKEPPKAAETQPGA